MSVHAPAWYLTVVNLKSTEVDVEHGTNTLQGETFALGVMQDPADKQMRFHRILWD